MPYERQLNFYIDATGPEWYIESQDGASLLAAQVRNISYGELVKCSVQLTDGVPEFNESGTLQNPWTAFYGSSATGEIVVDNNFNWWDDCKLKTPLTAGTAVSTLQIADLSAVPRAIGSIRLSASDIVHYNAFSVSSGIYTFTLADESFETDSFTPADSYAADTPVRIIEMPVIVSAENSAAPATGLFSGLLDAANPVYESLIEGSSGISGTQLEFSVYSAGRAVFRARIPFDCLSAISPGEGAEYVRPSVWTESDSRYLQFANLSLSASSLPAGSTPSAVPVVTGNHLLIQLGIPQGAQGIQGEQGEQGDDGITYDWIGGDTAPSGNTGKDGDWYLDTTAGNVYNKISGAWVLKLNIIGKTGAGITLRGAWVLTTSYQAADMVTYQGSAYIAERTNIGVVPGSSGSESDWTLYISKGDTGATGQNGADGADGVTPHIGNNGNWYIGDTDTEVHAQGPAGQNGTNGTNGADGVTPHIGNNGNWYIGDTDTEVHAQGPAGQNGTNGTNGADGITPTINSTNKHWMIGSTDTGVLAEATFTNAFIDVTTVNSSNQTSFTGINIIPVGIKAPSGKFYALEKESLTIDTSTGTSTLTFDAYLAYENASSFSGTWRVYFSGGQKGDPGPQGATGPQGPQGAVSVVVSATEPASPVEGMLWIQAV